MLMFCAWARPPAARTEGDQASSGSQLQPPRECRPPASEARGLRATLARRVHHRTGMNADALIV
jgi:hypothetical protein